jgi:mycothiol synthase
MAASPAVRVRGAVPEDLSRLRRIAAETLRWDPDAAALPELLWPAAFPGLAVVAEADAEAGARAEAEVVGFALGSLGAVPADPAVERRGHVNLLAVAAAHRRRGVGSALLARLEARLLAAGASVTMIGGATPVFAWPGLDLRYTAASCLVEARGYQQVRDAVNMTVDLAAAMRAGRLETGAEETRLAAAGITVRALREEDREPIEPWLTAWGGTWKQETLSTLGRGDAGTYIAVLRDGAADAEYVGFASHGVNRSGWFGPMGTAGPSRGLGIGAVLLRQCLADVHAAGHATAQICWVGPVSFYARTVDAYVERVFRLYRRER